MSERTYTIVAQVRHHDDSGALDVQVSMQYCEEPFHLLLDDTDTVKGRGVLREEVVRMIRLALRFAM